MTREQILRLAKAESTKVVDHDLLGNPITDADILLMSAYGPLVIRIANAAIQQYKDSLLKDVGEPVAYMTTDEEGSASMLFFDRAEALKYSGDEEPVNLFTESQLTARVRELEEENARLKVMEESALKVCGQLDEVVIALPYDYLDSPDGGDASLGEQVKRMYSEVKTLRHAVVASQAYAKQLREAIEQYLAENDPSEFGCACDPSVGHLCGPCFAHKQQAVLREALSQPTSTEALDSYVAEKVKEAMLPVADQLQKERLQAITDFGQYQEAHDQIATLTRQRDLAVYVLNEASVYLAYCKPIEAMREIRKALSTIKESEK